MGGTRQRYVFSPRRRSLYHGLLLFLLVPLLCAFVPKPAPGLVLHGSRHGRLLALTFDADPVGYDSLIVQELVRSHVPATIFLTGLFMLRHPRLVRSLATRPYLELENHSLDHGAWEQPCYGLPTVAVGKRREVLAAARLLERTTGRRPRYFRFPGGCQDETDIKLVRSLGEQPVQWDVVSGDAYLRDPRLVERQVLDLIHPGSIVVMHLNGSPRAPATAAALAALLPALQGRGYRFVTVARLLGNSPPRG